MGNAGCGLCEGGGELMASANGCFLWGWKRGRGRRFGGLCDDVDCLRRSSKNL